MKTQAEELQELMDSRYAPLSEASAVVGVSAVELSDSLGVITGSETLVRQEFKDEVDVNTILSRFGINVVAAYGNKKAMYGDFTGIFDYDSAVAKVEDVERRFMSLDPTLREKFDNDPGKLMRAVDTMTPEEFEKFVAPSVAVAPAEPVTP